MSDNAWIDELKPARLETNMSNGLSYPIDFPSHEEALVIVVFEGENYIIERGLLRLFVERHMLTPANATEVAP